MLITSEITKNHYQWIKVPRTATTAYSKLLYSKFISRMPVLHQHLRYGDFSLCEECESNNSISNKIDAFTVVRNPYDRFVSTLYFLNYSRQIIGKNHEFYDVCDNCKSSKEIIINTSDFYDFFKDENTFYSFFYDNFFKNCELKHEDIYRYTRLGDWTIPVFFKTQMYWAYHPRVKIFKYENLNEFNSWLEYEFLYDTKKLTRENYSDKKLVLPIDTSTDKFKALVKYLFHDDFLCFGYDFPI